MNMRKAWAGIAAVAAAALVGALGAAPSPAFAAGIGVNNAADLQGAIDDSMIDTVILDDDITASVTVPEGKTLVIDLNGHTLTNEDGKHTITNNGTLTITGDGTVDNVSHGKAAVYNNVGGTATLGAANYTRSKEAGSSPDEPNGNSYYNILNQGTMTIESGAVVKQDGHFSSLIDNGWYSGSQNTGKVPAKLTINGGDFSGGINTIKNDDWGELVINDGTFSNNTGAALMNWNVAEVNGGTFNITQDGARVFSNGYGDDVMDKGQLTITNGTFTASDNGAGDLFTSGKDSANGGTVSISGGTFVGALNGIEANAINVSVSGGTFSDQNVIKHVAADTAVVKSTEGFSVKAGTDAAETSLAKVVVNGTNLYFDSVDDAKAYAKENGYPESDVQVVQYVVTFVANGETTDVYYVKVGEALGELPEIPEYEGHTVDGWYVNVTENADGSATGTKIDETYVPTGDTTVTAMWTENAPVTPSTPAADTKPAEAPKKALPQTGDNTNAVLPVVIAGVGIVVIAAAIVLRRRHN